MFYSQSSQVKEDPSSFTVHPEVSGGAGDEVRRNSHRYEVKYIC